MTFAPVIPLAVLVLAGFVLVAFAVIALVRGSARLAWALRIVMVVLLILIAVRPVIPGGQVGPSASGGLEVYFAVDTTSSMAAEDYDGSDTRLTGVKADIAAIGEQLEGAQYSLVTFDSSTIQRVPLTTDVTALESASSVMTQEVTNYSQGSSVDEPVEFLTDLLTKSKKANPGNTRVLFYLGDGEQTTGEQPGPFTALKPLISGGGVLGYGTATGGRMLEFDGYDDEYSQLDYIQDYSSGVATDAISKIDEAELQSIATDLGVSYTHRTAPDSVAAVISGLDVGALTIKPGTPGGPFELYWLFAIPLGLLVLVELVRLGSALREVRPAKEKS